MKNNETTVALLLGGSSPEREVSKSSGKSIYEALKKLDYKIKIIDPAYGINQPKEDFKFFDKVDYSEVNNKNYIEAVNSSLFDDIDVAFNGLHGKWGEDGTVQSLLELRGIKYTGSGILASSLSMDKSLSKIMFQHYDVKTPKWFLAKNDLTDTDVIKNKIKKFFGFPCVIKPNDSGSTIGLTICRGESEIEDALELSFKYGNTTIVEEYIPGHEMTVGILGQHVFPVLEIKPKHNLYDYECKYTTGMSEYIVPANFPKETCDHLKHQALLAYNSIGCENYARVDFRMTDKLDAYCLEVNTLPGMTDTSLVPKMAKAEAISFEELIDRIIKNSMK